MLLLALSAACTARVTSGAECSPLSCRFDLSDGGCLSAVPICCDGAHAGCVKTEDDQILQLTDAGTAGCTEVPSAKCQ
ncbi:MAG: hypothetical protein IPJ65_12365 [Archangiaceae bacterium]|nr:hypothetical protein [Archangiaceae bacterium]